MSEDRHDEIQALRVALKEAVQERERLREERDALAARAVTDAEWADVVRERATAEKRRLCPHMSIEAGSNRCLNCGGRWNGSESYKPPEK